jgi:hypothetical protein
MYFWAAMSLRFFNLNEYPVSDSRFGLLKILPDAVFQVEERLFTIAFQAEEINVCISVPVGTRINLIPSELGGYNRRRHGDGHLWRASKRLRRARRKGAVELKPFCWQLHKRVDGF